MKEGSAQAALGSEPGAEVGRAATHPGADGDSMMRSFRAKSPLASS